MPPEPPARPDRPDPADRPDPVDSLNSLDSLVASLGASGGVLADPERTHAFGVALARLLRAGDLVVLTGDLGAGKTTLTQGIGAGLGVRGPVTSPTFVIARVHPSLVGGPALVHVDAYRLGSTLELDDLDLDTSLGDAVTVIEWGAGLVEQLSEDRLEVTLVADADTEERSVTLTGVGWRWT
ncbi:MAG: tRNA (adenosine(37)-N6)-threonylcarbamoyltransferase complex ATPase subunit type 1 TsaE [Dermatophilaceae bacterium]